MTPLVRGGAKVSASLDGVLQRGTTGASISERPTLFGAAYIGPRLFDMLRNQDFSGGALWAPEYGLSSDPEVFKWLSAYSPLQNIGKGICHPPTLIKTSWTMIGPSSSAADSSERLQFPSRLKCQCRACLATSHFTSSIVRSKPPARLGSTRYLPFTIIVGVPST